MAASRTSNAGRVTRRRPRLYGELEEDDGYPSSSEEGELHRHDVEERGERVERRDTGHKTYRTSATAKMPSTSHVRPSSSTRHRREYVPESEGSRRRRRKHSSVDHEETEFRSRPATRSELELLRRNEGSRSYEDHLDRSHPRERRETYLAEDSRPPVSGRKREGRKSQSHHGDTADDARRSRAYPSRRNSTVGRSEDVPSTRYA